MLANQITHGVVLAVLSSVLLVGCAASSSSTDEDEQRAVVDVDTGNLAVENNEARFSPHVTNHTTRTQADMDADVFGGMRKVFNAPRSGIDLDEGRDITTGPGAHYLLPAVYLTIVGSQVTAKVSLAVFTYPGLSLVGTLSKTLTVPSAPTPNDPVYQDWLIDLTAQKAAQQFADNLSSF